MPKVSFQYSLGALFILSSLFPWVSFGLTGFETQLWHVFWGGGFLLAFSHFRYPINVITPFFGFVFAFLVVSIELDFSALSARGLVSYFSFAVAFVAFYLYLERYGPPLKIFLFANLVWLAVSVMQAIWGSDIFDWAVPARTSLERGMPSLASEPTYFAIFLFFLSWLVLIFQSYKPSRLIIMVVLCNVFFILLVARSSMVVFYFIILIFLYCFFYLRISHLHIYILSALMCLFFYFSLIFLLPESRITSLSQMALNDPLSIFFLDASANERLKNIAFPVLGFFDNYLLPGGFHSFREKHDLLLTSYGGFFWYGEGGDKILSMLGAVVYELGFLGVMFILMLGWLVFDGTKENFLELALLFILCFSAISLAFPLFPLLLAAMYFRKKRIGYVQQ